MAVEFRRRLFTVDEYHRMVEVGILTPDDPVELLDGEIIEMTPMDPPHAGCVIRLNRLFMTQVGERATVGVQTPVILDDRSEPEPDLWIGHRRDDDYATAHPRPDDLLLVVEVAHSSVLLDRNRKIPRYGAAGVPEAWLVDVGARRIEVHREPTPDGYAQRSVGEGTATLSPLAFPEISFTAGEILG